MLKEYLLPIVNLCPKSIERSFATFELGKIEMAQGNYDKAREYLKLLFAKFKKVSCV